MLELVVIVIFVEFIFNASVGLLGDKLAVAHNRMAVVAQMGRCNPDSAWHLYLADNYGPVGY
jgi:hypothetical protein